MLTELHLESQFNDTEKALKAALPATANLELELILERSHSLSLSVQKGSLEKFDTSQSQCAGFRVLLDGVPGYAWTEDLSPEALLLTAQNAVSNAKFAASGSSTSSETLTLLSDTQEVQEDPSLYHPSLHALDWEKKRQRAFDLESVALSVDPKIQSVPYNGYTEVESETQIFNSRGVRRKQRRTSVSGSSYCLANDGSDSKMSGESFFVRDTRKADPHKVAVAAAQDTLSRLGATQPQTGKYPIVIDSRVASDLMGLLADSFSAKSVFEKNSLLTGKIGQKIAAPCFQLRDDPAIPEAPGSRPFDSEGAKTRPTLLIEQGILKQFLTDSVHAQKMNLPHTASAARGPRSELGIGPSNLLVSTGQDSLEQLLSRYPRVIYITEFKGFHSSYQKGSGDFSFPSEGELWENGKKVGPLAEFVTSGNILELLNSIEAVSARIRHTDRSIQAPDLLVYGPSQGLMVAGRK